MSELLHKLGPHIEWPGRGIDLIALWRPPICLLMNVTGDVIRRVREASPGIFVIVRKEDGRRWRDKDPVDWADEVWDMVRDCPPDAVVADNEPLGHDETHLFAAFDQWQAAFISRMRQHGVETGGFSFGEGNFTRDGPNVAECFPISTAMLKYVFVHEYWKPYFHSDGMQGYHCLRWPTWLQWFEAAGRPDIKIVVTECGMTMAVGGGPDVGYLSEEAKAAGVTRESYLDSLSQYHAACCQEPRVLACLPFNWYSYGKFSSFEHAYDPEVIEIVMNMRAPGEIPEEPEPPEPPEEPEEPDNGGEDMDLENIKVVAWDEANQKHVELETLAEKTALVEGKYGVEFMRANVAAGQKVYRLTELWEKSGNSSLVTQVLNEDGQPVDQQDVAFYWPDAPDPPDPPTQVLPHDWRRDEAKEWHQDGGPDTRFVHGPTNVNGDVGPGMGRGAYHGPGEGGPHAVWVRGPIPSDICYNLGMLAGTPHDHLDQKFQLMTQGEESEPPPVEPGGMRYVFDHKKIIQHPLGAVYILWPDDEMAIDTNAWGGIVGEDGDIPLDVSDPIRKEYDGKSYARSEMSTAGTYQGTRVFFIQIHKMDAQLTPLCERQKASFVQGEQKGVMFFMKHADGGNGEEPPPSGEFEQRLAVVEAKWAAFEDAMKLLFGA